MLLKNRFKVKSKVRFSIFIILLLLTFGITVNTLMGLDFAQGKRKTNYTTVQVVENETLWDIASIYANKGSDVRELIYKIKKYNNLGESNIIPGQVIKVPLE